MAISLVGNATNSGNTITIPTHQAGDIIVISASRANNTAPTIPSGWTQIQRAGANTLSLATGYRVATNSSTVSGTWTNAARLTCLVIRGVDGSIGIGGSATNNGSAQTYQRYPALTLSNANGESMVFYTYTRNNTSGITTAPTNYTNINSVATTPVIGAHNRASVSANPTQQDVTGLTSGNYRTHGFEITFTPTVTWDTITDSFNSGQDTALWGTFGTGVSFTNARVEVTVAGTSHQYTGISTGSASPSAVRYSLVGSHAQIELVSTGTLNVASWQCFPLEVYFNDDNHLQFAVVDGDLISRKRVSGTYTTTATATYSSSSHRFLRIRESSGTVYWEYSADGTSWTSLHSESNPFSLNDVLITCFAGMWQAESETRTMILDNFNIAPSKGSSERGLWLEGVVAGTSTSSERGLWLSGASTGSSERGLWLDGTIITYESGVLEHSPGYNNSHTISHNASGSDRLAVAIVFCRHMADVVGVTYDGVSMTKQAESVGGSTTRAAAIYTLVNPPTGAKNVVLSLGSNYRRFSFFVGSFSNVDQTDPINATGEATPGNGTTATTSITSTEDNSLIVDAVQTQDDRTLSVGSGQIEIAYEDHPATDQGSAGTSSKNLASAGATTMVWTWNYIPDNSDNWAACAIAITPKTESGTPGSSERGLWLSGVSTSFSERGLWLQGSNTDTSERTLWLSGASAGFSERSLWLSGVDTGFSERGLWVRGGNSGSSERGLWLSGISTGFSERGLWVRGSDSGSSERPLWLAGRDSSSSERALWLAGRDSSSSERALWLRGKESGASERTLWLSSSNTGSSERSLWLSGINTDSSERGLWLQGSLPESSERPLWLRGSLTDQSERALWLEGQVVAGDGFSERSLWLSGIDASSSERSLWLSGYDSYYSERNIYIHGLGGEVSERSLWLSGSAIDASERPLWLEGSPVASERSLWVQGSLGNTSERALWLVGSGVGASERTLWLSGVSTGSSERGLWISGKESSLSERPLWLSGASTGSLERSLWLSGSAGGSSERGLYLSGVSVDSSERGLYLVGSSPGHSEVGLYLVGDGTPSAPSDEFILELDPGIFINLTTGKIYFKL
jgi:hypothetical protein